MVGQLSQPAGEGVADPTRAKPMAHLQPPAIVDRSPVTERLEVGDSRTRLEDVAQAWAPCGTEERTKPEVDRA